MSPPRKPHPIESLSFVKDRAPNSRSNLRRCFWSVEPTGDYQEDWRMGYRLAIEFLRYEVLDQGGPGHLQWVVGDMRESPHDGIAGGFLNTVGYARRGNKPRGIGLLKGLMPK